MILQTAIEHYGVEKQLDKVDEELNELIEALDNWRKDHHEIHNLIDEIADVEIMLIQLKMILQDRYEDSYIGIMINDRKEFKLDRLKQRIEDDNNKSRFIQKD